MKAFLSIFLSIVYPIITVCQTPCLSPSVSGTLTYDNITNTPLTGSTVYLNTPSGTRIDSSLVDQNGNYHFCDVPAGSYFLNAKTSIPWGGVTSIDAFLTLKEFTVGNVLTGLKIQAGDGNKSMYINATDALIILERYYHIINSLTLADWVFGEPQINVEDTISHVVDLKGLCSGDVDGSYIPFQTFVTCGDTLTDERDLQKYPTVQIGDQCWMQRNLNIGNMVTSTYQSYSHTDCSNNGIIEKYCYDNNPVNCSIYGALYNWNEMMQYDTIPGAQGICPTGWHIPTNDDWCTMTTYLDTTVSCIVDTYSGTSIGGKLKETGTIHWKSPNSGATNESGFSAIGNGNRSKNGTFDLIRNYGNFWSSSVGDMVNRIFWWGTAYNRTDLVYWAGYPIDTSLALAVRCIKN